MTLPDSPPPSDASPPRGPQGQGGHVVQRGDSIESIAFALGYAPQTLWDHPDNHALREARRDGNVLLQGDRLTIPAKEITSTMCATGKRYTFRRRGVPSRFRLRLLEDDRPRADVPFTLLVDRTTQRGRTDADGKIDVPIPPNASRGTLTVGEEDDAIEYALTFGTLDPATEPSGAAQRLVNLGYDCGSGSDEDLALALRAFQRREGMEETGTLDHATAMALIAVHDDA